MKKRIALLTLLIGVAILAGMTLVDCVLDSGMVNGYASGAITAKGSIFVNGVEYDTTSATITVNGALATEADLKVGMLVELKGEIDTSTQKGVAAEIDSSNSMEGPISAIAGSDITVLGQTVIVDSSTRFEAPLTDIGSLAVNDVIGVTGFPNGLGAFVASYIERIGSSAYEIEGTVSSLAASSFTLTLPGGVALTVNFSGTLAAGIADGSFVEVKFSTFSSLTITTSAGEVELKQELMPDEGDYVEVEGFASNLAGTSFDVGRIAVNAGSLSLASVANGTKVEVKGTFSSGTLMAGSIELK